MPWTCCGTSLLDSLPSCPACGAGKEKWTLRLARTRVFQIGGAPELEWSDEHDEPDLLELGEGGDDEPDLLELGEGEAEAPPLLELGLTVREPARP